MNREAINHNERGMAALISVVTVALALVVSMSSIYVYIMNRTRQQLQIKEAYKLVNITEEAAKVVRLAFDQDSSGLALPNPGFGPQWNNNCCNGKDPSCTGTPGIQNGPGPSCSNSTINCGGNCGPANPICLQQASCLMQSGVANSFPAPDPSCTKSGGNKGGCVKNNPNGQKLLMCFQNVDNADNPYCFYGNNELISFSKLEIRQPDQFLPVTPLKKFYARLDGFFDGSPLFEKVLTLKSDPKEMLAFKASKIMGWLLSEKEAQAAATGTIVNTMAAITPCVAGTPYGTSGCLQCGPGTQHTCASVASCPTLYSQCATWNGSYQTALFVQEFMISPPCDPTSGICY